MTYIKMIVNYKNEPQVAKIKIMQKAQDGNENLLKEGVPENKIYLVGNVMIDTLVRLSTKA